jgi:hypothetical protein
MIDPQEMTDEQLVKWAKKTFRTISNSYWKSAQYRRDTMVDRYHELKEEMEIRKIWHFYCAETGSATSHDAYDITA